ARRRRQRQVQLLRGPTAGEKLRGERAVLRGQRGALRRERGVEAGEAVPACGVDVREQGRDEAVPEALREVFVERPARQAEGRIEVGRAELRCQAAGEGAVERHVPRPERLGRNLRIQGALPGAPGGKPLYEPAVDPAVGVLDLLE